MAFELYPLVHRMIVEVLLIVLLGHGAIKIIRSLR
jgi:hypothetical protein